MATCLSINCVSAQDDKTPIAPSEKIVYCSMIMDGHPVLILNERLVEQDVTLANGTIVRTDGTVEIKDKTNYILKYRECIDQDGKIRIMDDKLKMTTPTEIK